MCGGFLGIGNHSMQCILSFYSINLLVNLVFLKREKKPVPFSVF